MALNGLRSATLYARLLDGLLISELAIVIIVHCRCIAAELRESRVVVAGSGRASRAHGRAVVPRVAQSALATAFVWHGHANQGAHHTDENDNDVDEEDPRRDESLLDDATAEHIRDVRYGTRDFVR